VAVSWPWASRDVRAVVVAGLHAMAAEMEAQRQRREDTTAGRARAGQDSGDQGVTDPPERLSAVQTNDSKRVSWSLDPGKV
jgi:hypothetical protein